MRKSIVTVVLFASFLFPLGNAVKADAVTGVSQTKTASVSTSKKEWKCPKWHALMREHKLPVRLFDPIMYRESRCKAKVIGWNYHRGMSHRDCKLEPADKYKKCKAVKSYDSGLLQINSSWKTVTSRVCKSKMGDMTVLLDPKCNLKVASYLYHKGGGIANWRGTSGAQR